MNIYFNGEKISQKQLGKLLDYTDKFACLLCGDRNYSDHMLGLFHPLKSEEFGGFKDKQRVIPYKVCTQCKEKHKDKLAQECEDQITMEYKLGLFEKRDFNTVFG